MGDKKYPFSGKHHTNESKRKISESLKGKTAGKHHYLWGKHPSKKSIRKMIKNRKGKCVGKDHPFYGKPLPQKTKRKISKALLGKKNPFWGKHHTEETKKKIGSANSKKTRSNETKQKISKTIMGRPISKKTREKMRKAAIERFNKKPEYKTKLVKARSLWLKKHPEFLEKLRQRCINFNRVGYRPSKFEKKIMKLIKENNLPYKYVGDFQLIIGGKCPDFVNINGQKIVVEAYEDSYWHDKNYVKQRTEHFLKFGFETKFIHYKDTTEKIISTLKGGF